MLRCYDLRSCDPSLIVPRIPISDYVAYLSFMFVCVCVEIERERGGERGLGSVDIYICKIK